MPLRRREPRQLRSVAAGSVESEAFTGPVLACSILSRVYGPYCPSAVTPLFFCVRLRAASVALVFRTSAI